MVRSCRFTTLYNLRGKSLVVLCKYKIKGVLIYPVSFKGKMKMLYCPSQYGAITAQSGSSHLMQDDAFGDSLSPPVNIPSGAATLQTALSCITGNENTVELKSLWDERFITIGFLRVPLCTQRLHLCLRVCVYRVRWPRPSTGSSSQSRAAWRGFLHCGGPLHQSALLHLYRAVTPLHCTVLLLCTAQCPSFIFLKMFNLAK